MESLLHSSWARAWSGLRAQGDGLSLRDAVLARYAESHRRYHTCQHLEECLELFEVTRFAPDRPDEVEMALWFHDAIYDLKSSENETRSAAWAEDALRAAGVNEDAVTRVRDLISITRHTGVPHSSDEKVLVDIDLAILGAPAERFSKYERQIREEYAYVPELLFRLTRRSILQGFIDRESIYSTPLIHRRLETRARANLAAAISASAANG